MTTVLGINFLIISEIAAVTAIMCVVVAIILCALDSCGYIRIPTWFIAALAVAGIILEFVGVRLERRAGENLGAIERFVPEKCLVP